MDMGTDLLELRMLSDGTDREDMIKINTRDGYGH